MEERMARPSIIVDRRVINLSLPRAVAEAMREVSRRERRPVSRLLDDLFCDHVRARHPDLVASLTPGAPPVVLS
jgi:acyl carrier protein phosphodiesterase